MNLNIVDIFKIAAKIATQHAPLTVGEIMALSVTDHDTAMVEYDAMCDSLSFKEQNNLRNLIDKRVFSKNVVIDTMLKGGVFDVYEFPGYKACIIANVNDKSITCNISDKLKMVIEGEQKAFIAKYESIYGDIIGVDDIHPITSMGMYDYTRSNFFMDFQINDKKYFFEKKHVKISKKLEWQKLSLMIYELY